MGGSYVFGGSTLEKYGFKKNNTFFQADLAGLGKYHTGVNGLDWGL